MSQLSSTHIYALSPYEYGYDHGCDDAEISNPSDRYINSPGYINGPRNWPTDNREAFSTGYYAGLKTCSTSDTYPAIQPPPFQSSTTSDLLPDCKAAAMLGGFAGALLGSLAGPLGTVEGGAAGASLGSTLCNSP